MLRTAFVVLLTLLVACGDGTGPAPVVRGDFVVVSGADQTDTVRAGLPAPLVVELHDSTGRALPNAALAFEASCTGGCDVYFRRDTAGLWTGAALDTTDVDGRSQVYLRLGRRAGSDIAVAVWSPEAGARDTVLLTVRPGLAAGVAATPADTAVYVGVSYALHPRVVDIWGNTRPDPVTVTAVDQNIAVSTAGRLTARSVGRGRIAISGAGFADTAAVSVVPNGTVALLSFASTVQLAVMELDESGFQPLADAGNGAGRMPAWDPSGQRLAYARGDPANGGSRLYLVGPTDPGTPLITSQAASFAEEDQPRWSRDGNWIYFRGYRAGENAGELWRIHPDGSGLDRVGAAGTPDGGDFDPDPSPDGTQLAYTSNRGGTLHLVVRTLADGSERSIAGLSRTPRWSPDGGSIAYWSGNLSLGVGGIHISRADGADARQVTDPAVAYYDGGLDWSPDGRWLLAQTGTRIQLVSVSGLPVLPLPQSRRWAWAAWKP